MKILKYLILLLLLVFIASSVFVATLKPDYDIVRSKTINASKTDVFNYVSNFKNWEKFVYWNTKTSLTKFNYSANTIGNGAILSWKSQNDEGKIITILSKKNDSIHQKMSFNDTDSDVYWTFSEVDGKTNLTYRNIGKMDFFNKIITTLFGGAENQLGNLYQKSLDKIQKNLTTQPKLHSIVEDGFTEFTIGMYLQKTIYSANENIDSNIAIMIPKILKFISDNKIAVNGKPFVKYNSVYKASKISNISVCVPIKDSIITSSESEYTFANMLPFQAMKTTLKGDLIYKSLAKEKALSMITSNNLVQKLENPVIEVYKVNKTENKDSNFWITEIYIPVKKKEIEKKYIKPIIKSDNVTTQIPKTEPTITPSKAPNTEKIIILKKDFPQ